PRNASDAAALGRKAQIENAALFAANTLPIVDAIRATGTTDLRGIAAALNARGIRTARGGYWHVSNVKNLIDRSDRLAKSGLFPLIDGKKLRRLGSQPSVSGCFRCMGL